ncbi:sialic acid-binding Ig-like lectin 14 isoform X2 [Mirounga leonina]|uniref:sialic acid-binding Ig-like lectin 14 isoform X2 n=1 Tax=Mirounga leonina TaxID=9715 RepID=UPI00156C370F|nr:sialic acid-binding Ig-like lectin 14 isoform X2 [Mirounga leonina]
MGPLLLLSLLWGGSLQEDPGFELRVQDSVTVQEGLCVHVPCSFSYPRSPWYSREKPYVYWFRNGDSRYLVATNDQRKMVMIEARGRFHLIGNPWDNNCSLRIREARKSDQGVYKFRMERDNVKYNYRDKKLMVQVAALTQKPDIHFPEPLKSGYPTNLTCSMLGSCEEGRPLTFSWVGDALDSLDPQTLHSSVLTLTPRLQDHGSNLTCQVHLPGQDTVERTIRLNVSYAPQLMTTRILQRNYTVLKTPCNHTSLPVLEGQFLRLVCIAESNPPATLSWSREGKALSPSEPSAPGVLELPHVGVEDEGEFTCQAQHPLGSQHVSFCLFVQRTPSSCNCVTEKQEGSWPLVITLIRGVLMGAGFLLTYGLTWIYYTRCGDPQGVGLRGLIEPPSFSRQD